jgi:hypothetical protein
MSAGKIAPALGAHDDRKPTGPATTALNHSAAADLGELASRRKQKAPAKAEAL